MLKKLHHYLLSAPANLKHFKIVHFAFWGMTIVLFAWFFYFSLSTIFMPFPIEYREGAAQVMTQILLNGGNPFSLEYQPLAMNNYGIGYNLAAFPFAKLFGNTLLIHRGVNFCFLFATLLLIVKAIWNHKRDILTACLAGLLIVVPLAGLGGLGAFPSAMGTFLFLAAIIIPFRYSFCTSSLIASAVLSIAAFYTKPYFMIGFGVVAAYVFIFVSKRKGVIFSLLFLAAFSMSFLAVRNIFELYFIDTLISNLSNAELSSAHMQNQLRQLYMELLPVVLLAGILLLLNRPGFSSTAVLQEKFRWKANVSEWDAPLALMPLNYFAFVFIACFLIFVYGLGPHLGNYMTYAYQIILPPFILWVLQALNTKWRVSILAWGLLSINILSLEYMLLNPSFLHQWESAAWNKLYQYVNDVQYVANSPVMVSALIERAIPPVDSGQTQYYFKIQPYPEQKLIGPGYETIKGDGIAYRFALLNDVRQHKFDRIFITQRARNLLPVDLVAEYYVQVDTLTVEMPQTHQTWNIEIWEPTDK